MPRSNLLETTWIKKLVSVMHNLITRVKCCTCLAFLLFAAVSLHEEGLSHTGSVADLSRMAFTEFLPSVADLEKVRKSLVILVSRVLTKYIESLQPLSTSVVAHIPHQYSKEMSKKSNLAVLDVLLKNEACSADMIDIMRTMQGYLGKDYLPEHRVASGGDQLTGERQAASQRHMMDSNSPAERLRLLEPQAEDWHTLVCLLRVS